METQRLHVDVEPASAEVQVVRATGPLSLATVAALRTGADKALTRHPHLLVIDLSGVVLRDRLAARVLPLIAADASVWPVTRVVIAGAAADIEGSLRRTTGLSRFVWFPDVASAENAATQGPATARIALPRDSVVWAVVGTAARVHRSIQVTCAR